MAARTLIRAGGFCALALVLLAATGPLLAADAGLALEQVTSGPTGVGPQR